MSFWRKWWAWLFPQPEWKKRYRRFKSGCTIWEIPGQPGKRALLFPVEWVPHRLTDLSAREEEAGFAIEDVICCDSGKSAPRGVGVLCLRCGVPLHPDAAGMVAPLDPPRCKRCAPLLLLVL